MHAHQQAPQLGSGPPILSRWSLNAAPWWDFLQCFLRQLYSHRGCSGQAGAGHQAPTQAACGNLCPLPWFSPKHAAENACTSHSVYVAKDQWLFNNISTNNFFWLLSLTVGSQRFWGTAGSAKSLGKSPHLWYLSATQPSHSNFPSVVFHGLEHVARWPIPNSCATLLQERLSVITFG